MKRSPYPSPEALLEERATLHGPECRNYSTRQHPYQHVTVHASGAIVSHSLDAWEKAEAEHHKQQQKGRAEPLRRRGVLFSDRLARRNAADSKRGYVRI